ncbi:MAG TPA: CAP domain-containing protein [Rhizomicrobium sp.]|nr:CAP domain-containing protein [Rhizomicrobium sp.]
MLAEILDRLAPSVPPRARMAGAAIFVAAGLSLAACATQRQAAPPAPDPQSLMPALEQRIALLVEEERERTDARAQPLAIDPELTRIARERSQDMARKNYFAHAAPDGQTSASLLMDEDPRFQGLLGENLAAEHYVKSAPLDVNATARSIVDQWLKSPRHRENLALADYALTGVGAAANGDTIYVTELFAAGLATDGPGEAAPGDPK